MLRDIASIGLLGSAAIALVVGLSQSADAAQPGTIVICKGPITPAKAAVCGTVGLVVHELGQKKPFSNRGEIARAGTHSRN